MNKLFLIFFFIIIILLVSIKYFNNKAEHFGVISFLGGEIDKGSAKFESVTGIPIKSKVIDPIESKVIDPIESTVDSKIIDPIEKKIESTVIDPGIDILLNSAKNKLEKKIVSLPFVNGKLTTQDIEPIMSQFFSIEKIQQIENDAETFLSNLADIIFNSDKVINFLLSLGKVKIISILSPIFQSNNLSIDKIEPILDFIDSNSNNIDF